MTTTIKTHPRLIHPSEILVEEYMVPLGITEEQLHSATLISQQTLSRFIRGLFPIDAFVALNLSKAFDTTPEFWLNLQQSYDLGLERQRKGKEIDQLVECLNPTVKQEYELAQSKPYTPKVFEITVKDPYILNCFQYNGDLDNVPEPFEREQVQAILDKCRLPSNEYRTVTEGDIIIMGVAGQVFAVSPTVFEETYKII